MGLLREINLAGNASQVQNFVPGDNITFSPQSDGTIRINGQAGGDGGTLYPGMGQNTDGAMTQKASTDTYNNYNNVVLKTLAVSDWVLNGTVYEQEIQFTEIYDLQPSIVPCGSTLGSLPSGAQSAEAKRLKVIGDTETKTMTFYVSTTPSVDINLAIQGVA